MRRRRGREEGKNKVWAGEEEEARERERERKCLLAGKGRVGYKTPSPSGIIEVANNTEQYSLILGQKVYIRKTCINYFLVSSP